jgi:hypothetical protein
LPYQVREAQGIEVKNYQGFKASDPSNILTAMVQSKVFSSEQTDIYRGVNLDVLIGFSIPPVDKFYFATSPPHDFDASQIDIQAFADDQGQMPIWISRPFYITVTGKNLSQIHSKNPYIVIGLTEGNFHVTGLGRHGKERRLTKEEVRRAKPLPSRNTHSESSASSRESSPAGVACVPSHSWITVI